MKRLSESPTWRDDLASTTASLPELFIPQGSILVTGASGLIGSAFVDLLLDIRHRRNGSLRIIAAGRSVQRLAERFGVQDGLSFLEYDATKPFTFGEAVDSIVHAASNASPDLYVKDPCGTIAANVDGLRDILNVARENPGCRVLYISSSEVYGVRAHTGPAHEDDYGLVNPLNPRSSYAESKRAAEAICAAYVSQYGVAATIVRPGHIYGPTALATDRRVSSDFAFKAARGEALTLKSSGDQIRSYCHCLDCATAMLAVLARGTPATAYNISNPDSILTIREMSAHLARAGRCAFSFAEPSPMEKAAFNPMSDSSLSAERLLSLGWHSRFSAQQGLARTVQTLQEMIL